MIPAPDHWFSGPALYLAMSFIFVVTVALIGIKEMISGKLFCALIVAAAVLSVMAWYTAAKQEEANADLREQLVGGEGFCFVIGLYNNPQAKVFPLIVWNPGDEPLRNVTISILKIDTLEDTVNSLMHSAPIFIGTLFAKEFNHALAVTVPFGEYSIDIKTEAAAFVERLSLRFENGEIQQSYYVKSRGPNGKILFESGKVPPPTSQK